MTLLQVERAELLDFTAAVQADATRSLDLLRAIENTLVWLERLTGQLRTDAAFAEKANAGLVALEGAIDPEQEIQNALEEAQHEVEELYNLLIDKRQHGRNDGQLTDEDGIEDAYTDAISQAADLHNAINSLRWSIGEHDIDALPENQQKSYSANDVDKMFDDILES